MFSLPSLDTIPNHANFVKRPHWGGYLDLFRSDDLVIKILYFAPHGCLSLQKHQHRIEEWMVLRGPLDLVVNCDEKFILAEYRNRTHRKPRFKLGDPPIIIYREEWHFAQAFGEPAFVLEIQKGLCREDDIERRCFEEVTS